MAVNYVTVKCDSCASTKFDYIEATKMWRCKYCGAEMERQERSDSMYTIKNVVRQVLVDLAGANMDSALSNLTECQKIDRGYVGTLYAQLAYEVNRWKHAQNKSERDNQMECIKRDRAKILSFGDPLQDEEGILIDELGSSEARAVLILMFDLIGIESRRDALMENFDPSDIYIMDLNSELIGFALRTENYALFDKIIRNTNNINKKTALKQVFQHYPDGTQKGENIALLVRADENYTEDDGSANEQYLRTTQDCFGTRLTAAMAFCEKPFRPSVTCLMETVIGQASDVSQVKELFALLFRKRLEDQEANTVVNYALQSCSEDVCTYLLEMMRQADQYVAFTARQLSGVLARSDFSAEGKQRILDACGAFEIDTRVYDSLISLYLCEQADDSETRIGMTQYLLGKVPAVSTNSVERYLMNCSLDQEKKPDMVRLLFSGDFNRSFYQSTVEKYLGSSCDTAAVKTEVLYILTELGLGVNTTACVRMLCSSRTDAENRLEMYRRIKAGNTNRSEVCSQYLLQVSAQDFSPAVFAELLSDTESITETALRRYVLELCDAAAAKAGNVSRLLSISYSQPVNIPCTVSVGGDTVCCDLLHAYLLTAPDQEDTATDVVRALGGSSVSGGDRITVNGDSIKIKKYAAACSKLGKLSPAAAAVCKKTGVL